MTGRATILRGDGRALPLPDASVDLIVTSPPYFGLRSYQDGGQHYGGQIGAEPTPAAYVDALIEATREWMRVLKPTGSIFVNLGDKYNSPTGHGQGVTSSPLMHSTGRKAFRGERGHTLRDVPRKSLMLLPERYRIAAVDELGLVARAVLVWSKPNGLPESVTDRVRRSHEDWVHLTKAPRYFSAVDAIREPHSAPDRTAGATAMRGRNASLTRTGTGTYDGPSPLGKLPGSVWEVATEPLTVPDEVGVDHFAAFPTEWPRRIIAGWSPSGTCTVCGEGRRPVTDRTVVFDKARDQDHASDIARRAVGRTTGSGGTAHSTLNGQTTRVITGDACSCPEPSAPTRPAVVLDPFGGTGTTALVARALGRHGISVDRSGDYCRLAAWRTSDPAQLAKALGVPAPRRELDGQLDLLAMEASA